MGLGKFISYIVQHKEGVVTGFGVFAVIYAGGILWKDKIGGEKYDISKAMDEESPGDASRQKVYLVTGANSGNNLNKTA